MSTSGCAVTGSLPKDSSSLEILILENFIRLEKTKQYKMLCLSDDKPELDFEKEKEWLKKLLQSYFPEKSSFEK